jgi:hypothetical protein
MQAVTDNHREQAEISSENIWVDSQWLCDKASAQRHDDSYHQQL